MARKEKFGARQTMWDLRHPARSNWRPRKTESHTLEELAKNSGGVFEAEVTEIKKQVIISIENEQKKDSKKIGE